MDRMEAFSWVLTVCAGLRLSQAKTLGDLVAGALDVGRVSLAELGRRLTGTTAKHRIKRAWRFTNNHRVQVSSAMQGVIRQLVRPKRKKPLVVSIDWVQVRQFRTIALCAAIDGRAIPLLWASYPEEEFHQRQHQLEEAILRQFRTMLPDGVRVILLADRGFGRTEMARLCQELRFQYVIRIVPDVWVQATDYEGNLRDFPVKKGICRCLRNVAYRKRNPVDHHIVIRWKKGLAKKRDECWFLMTNLQGNAVRISELFAKRMTIEEMFRDYKSRRNGFALRNTQIRRADRFDRLLLILVLAYILLLGIGLRARQLYCPQNWCSNTRQSECSVFTIGKRMRHHVDLTIQQIINALIRATQNAAPNWG
ncbi:MAG: transposase [Pirellulaceae bacterium]|nr:MAG: transposase [Pirellulaceae bacterium]GIW98903.1 MAG: transposase [Pirellulaceae bacterium]GIW99057.1 MAG: transposase [Pirellulaceae bacterium]GIW99061.1 MAG: transposase [Pirellulaceae bacterium]GIX00124.1 MAG: transposase [Pirellulaceae bacterium]